MANGRVIVTDKEFSEAKPGEIFAKGYAENSPIGIFMSREGGILKWVAVKGYNDDWSLYVHREHSPDYIVSKVGDKVITEWNIKKVLVISDELLKKYRY